MAGTTVIHVHDADLSDPDVVYIGRAVPRRGMRRSPWANPFTVQDWTRAGSVFLYLLTVLFGPTPSAQWIREHIPELRGKRLACWCAPQLCHGHVLAALADGPSSFAADRLFALVGDSFIQLEELKAASNAE
jgi:hypothetical protein